MEKRVVLTIIAASAFIVGAAPAANSPLAPVRAFMDAFNRGDVSSVRAAQHGTTLAIMDEVPPHLWVGGGAVDAWMSSLNAYDKAHGRTGGAVTLSAPQVTSAQRTAAYVVAPAVYTFKETGRPMREAATMTFALHRAASGWKIVGWAWNGTVPHPAAK